MRATRTILGVIDGLHRVRGGSPRARFQARFTVGSSLLGIAVAVPSLGVVLATEDRASAWMIGAFVAAVVLQLAAIRLGAPIGVLASTLFATVGAFLVAVSLTTRELRAEQPFWLVLLPLAALVLAGPRADDSEAVPPSRAVPGATLLAIVLGVFVIVAHEAGLSLDAPLRAKPGWASAVELVTFMIATFGLIHLYELSVRESQRELAQLRHLLSVCAWCGKIRSDGTWVPLGRYLADHRQTELSHGICPSCFEKEHPGVELPPEAPE